MEISESQSAASLDFVECVEQLVLNSINSGATCIAIRLNLNAYFIQVIDNGKGYERHILDLLGSTNRFWSTSTKKKSTSSCPEFGEVISRIAEFSTSLELVSQHEHCKETYKVYTSQSKSFCKAEKVQLRPACGTTVSINNYKPMRKCPNQQLMKERVEKLVTSLSLIHYNVTFSVRDDSGEEAIPFQTKRHRHTIEAAKHLFQLSKEQKLKSFHHSSQHFKIKGLIGTSGSEKHQYIYVNNRMVEQSAVSQLISSKFPWVNKDCARYAAILFNVKCSESEYVLMFDWKTRDVVFDHQDELLTLLHKCLDPFVRNLTGLPQIAQWRLQRAQPCLPELNRNGEMHESETTPALYTQLKERPQLAAKFNALLSNHIDSNELETISSSNFLSNEKIRLSSPGIAVNAATTTCRATARRPTFDPVRQYSFGKIPFNLEESYTDPCCYSHTGSVPVAPNQLGGTKMESLIQQWVEEREEEECSEFKQQDEDVFPYATSTSPVEDLAPATSAHPELKEIEVSQPQAQEHPAAEEGVELRNGKRTLQDILDDLQLMSKFPRIETDSASAGGESMQMEEPGDTQPLLSVGDNSDLPKEPQMNSFDFGGKIIFNKSSFNQLNEEFWDSFKRPLNFANSSNHSLPFYRAAPSRRRTYPKSIFEKMVIIKQVDRKFICCLAEHEGKQHLLLIDQHAAHERVCLEKLIQIHSTVDPDGFLQIQSSPLQPHLELSFKESDVEALQKLRSDLTRFGLHLRIDDSKKVSVTQVPTCFLSREISEVQRKRGSIYKCLVETLVQELIGHYLQSGLLNLHLLPTSIRDVLNSLACHGAIRFGDVLSMNQSIQLIRSLGKCDMPFQCAHGRPLLAPLLELDNLEPFTMKSLPRPKFSQLNEFAF